MLRPCKSASAFILGWWSLERWGRESTREPLAIVGETPNLAARLQGLAEPNTVVISAATHRLVDGFFTLHVSLVLMQ